NGIFFFGKEVPADPTTPFDLGTVVFANGTSALDSLIFGASISFYAGLPEPNASAAGVIPLGSSQISIMTTNNGFNIYEDADFITFQGVANKSLNAFEGAFASAELYGTITGDPVLTITDIVLDPGQELNGFIGNGQIVPEPTTVAM